MAFLYYDCVGIFKVNQFINFVSCMSNVYIEVMYEFTCFVSLTGHFSRVLLRSLGSQVSMSRLVVTIGMFYNEFYS